MQPPPKPLNQRCFVPYAEQGEQDKCKICRTPFVKATKNQRTCSRECGRLAEARRHQKARAKKKGKEK